MTSAALVPVSAGIVTRESVELVATEVEYLPVCAVCGRSATRLKRLGGVGQAVCSSCYQRAKRSARVGEIPLRMAALQATAPVLHNHLLAQGLGPKTIKQYMRTIWSAEAWFDGQGWSLATATPEQIVAYADTRPNSNATRLVLRCALMHYWELVGHPKPPRGAVRVPKHPAMVCRALEEEDAHTLAKAARLRGDRQGLAVLLGLYQAMRREEIATLPWAAIDDVDAGWVRIMGKGQKTRVIPLHPVVVDALGRHPRDSPRIFPGRFGGSVTCATIWEWVRLVAREAGLAPIRCHWLRHTALATQNDRTGDLRTVQAFAGHSKPETTAGYTRASKTKLQAAVMSLDY